MDKAITIVLGFDFGLKHIGVAVGQALTGTAQGVTSLAAKAGIPRWEEIATLIKTWRPDALVVGIPLNMDGTDQPITLAARAFVLELTERFPLPVYQADERLTTVESRARLFAMGGYKSLKKRNIDSLSAQLIVEGWLAEQLFKIK